MEQLKYALGIAMLAVCFPFFMLVVLIDAAVRNASGAFHMAAEAWKRKYMPDFLLVVTAVSGILYLAYYIFDKIVYFLADVILPPNRIVTDGMAFIIGFPIIFLFIAFAAALYSVPENENRGE